MFASFCRDVVRNTTEAISIISAVKMMKIARCRSIFFESSRSKKETLFTIHKCQFRLFSKSR